MSHVSKIVSLAVALLFAGGIALAQDPKMAPPSSRPTPPLPKPPVTTPGYFWFLVPTENEKFPAKTAFTVKLGANYPPPPGINLKWEWKVSGNWQPLDGPPTGATKNWNTKLGPRSSRSMFQKAPSNSPGTIACGPPGTGSYTPPGATFR